MRDTSAWTANPYTSKPVLEVTVSNLYPAFSWRNGATNYVISTLGETWGDAPATITVRRQGDLPTRYKYGGFVVGNDSLTLDNGNILRCTSEAAMNQGTDILYKYVTAASDLTGMDTLSALVGTPTTWSGIGLAKKSTNVATLFYINSDDDLLTSIDYTVGSGWANEGAVSNSPEFTRVGTAIAPISSTEGYLLAYGPTTRVTRLWHFNAGTWSSTVVGPRLDQHSLNCHWFDAVALDATTRLITFNINGTQYATIGTNAGDVRDPWRVLSFDPEFGGMQVRICKLTLVGSRVIATGWSRFASGAGAYEVSYYHLLWTDDGYNWAMPEEGFIGRSASRGKLHTLGSAAFIIGNSVSYVGSAVTWLGGSQGTLTTVASNIAEYGAVNDIDQASEIHVPLLITDAYDDSLFRYGNKITYRQGLVGEATKINMGTYYLDTPGIAVSDRDRQMELVARGPLKKLIGFTTPIDLTIDGPWTDYQDFSQGGIYARIGDWGEDADEGVGYCSSHDADLFAIGTVGTQYTGQFQINTRIRVTSRFYGSTASVIFWYEGANDYWRIDLVGPDNTLVLNKVIAGVVTEVDSVAVTGGLLGDTWYDILVRYISGVLDIYIRPNGSAWQAALSVSDWVDAEPFRWYAGLGCELPESTLTRELAIIETSRIFVADTDVFPASGNVEINNEIIYYDNKGDDILGSGEAGSLIRGIKSTRVQHPSDSEVRIANRRFEVDYFSVYQDDRPTSVYDMAAYLSTIAGVSFVPTMLVSDSNAGVRVFPELHSHGWVLTGTYDTTLTLYLWANTVATPTSGYKIVASSVASTFVLTDVAAASTIETLPISIPASGSFTVRAIEDTVVLWVDGVLVSAINLPKRDSYRVGCVAAGADITLIEAPELFEPSEGVVWSMQETARDALGRLIEGRDAYLRERYDGTIQVTYLEQRDDLGTFTGSYFVHYQKASADQEWASAMVAWGGEDWVMVQEPTADRLRWTTWQTPYIYDKTTLRDKAMRKLRKLWALKDVRSLQGPLDPRVEVGDELTISSIRGIPSGRYVVRSIEVNGKDELLDMVVSVYAVPSDISVATWPIQPGVDRPSIGS